MKRLDRAVRWKMRMRGDDGVASVIGTIFAILVLLTLLSLLITTYIPAWEKANEQEHMTDMVFRFSTVKSANLGMGTGEEQFLAVPLAPAKVPLFGKTVLGKLDFTPSSVSDTGISVTIGGATIGAKGSLDYRVFQNTLLEQVVSYEMGGVVLDQPDGGLVKVAPTISTIPAGGNNYELRITMFELSGADSDRVGDGSAGIRLEVTDVQNYNYDAAEATVVVSSAFASAWEDWFDDRFSGVADSIELDDDELTVEFSNLTSIEIKKVFTGVVLE